MVLYLGRMCQCGLYEVLWSLPRCGTSQYRFTFGSPDSISIERSYRLRIRWCGTGGFQGQGQCLLIGLAISSLFVSYCFPLLLFYSMDWNCGAGAFGLIGCVAQPCVVKCFK